MMQGWGWYGSIGWTLAGGILCVLLITAIVVGAFYLLKSIFPDSGQRNRSIRESTDQRSRT